MTDAAFERAIRSVRMQDGKQWTPLTQLEQGLHERIHQRDQLALERVIAADILALMRKEDQAAKVLEKQYVASGCLIAGPAIRIRRLAEFKSASLERACEIPEFRLGSIRSFREELTKRALHRKLQPIKETSSDNLWSDITDINFLIKEHDLRRDTNLHGQKYMIQLELLKRAGRIYVRNWTHRMKAFIVKQNELDDSDPIAEGIIPTFPRLKMLSKYIRMQQRGEDKTDVSNQKRYAEEDLAFAVQAQAAALQEHIATVTIEQIAVHTIGTRNAADVTLPAHIQRTLAVKELAKQKQQMENQKVTHC